MESLYHAGFENDSQVEINWVDCEDLHRPGRLQEAFADVDGIIVPGGFGDRGIEGMIQAAQYARENNVPYFGICLGMQIAVMEFARHVLGYADANSSEFTPEGHHNVIDLMADQQGNIPKGGTMRLGKYPCTVLPGTKMAECYGAERDLGAPPPPLRVQQRLPRGDAGRRSGHLRHQPRRPPGGDRGAARP